MSPNVSNGFKCRHCGKQFSSQGIRNHERACLAARTPRADVPLSLSSRRSQNFSPGEEQADEQSARYDFPKMLYKMLEDCTFDERYCKIVSWQSHGMAFKVHNREELEKILPLWFREKYESWRCLLEQWGFLKLTRGIDRGCWYHNKFYYLHSTSDSSNKRYENIDKADFIDGMPEYLSFREEPDLEKESTKNTRITPQKKKRMLDLLLEKDLKSQTVPALSKKLSSGKKRGQSDGKVKCRYCDNFFAPQGIKQHELACVNRTMKKRKIDKAEVDDSDITEDFSYDEGDQNSSSDSDDADNFEDMVKCRYCQRFYNKYGVKKHERSCKNSYRLSNPLEDTDSVNSDDVPCRFCGNLFSKFGLKNHERKCDGDGKNKRSNTKVDKRKVLKGSVNTKNDTGSILSDDTSVGSVGSGCRKCGFNDDHANLLLCEGCDTEVHTYCLTPPLKKVPSGDWFCDSCKIRMGKVGKEFDRLVEKVPSAMVERFGEMCFAKSAENAHWWPALIFDPRSFLHNTEVVDLTRRYLGKRYLVFFFENQDAFAAIPKRWIMPWDQAVEKEYDKGRSVKTASTTRKQQFRRAMNLANEAFKDGSSYDSGSDGMESTSAFDSDMDEDSLPPRIPRVIGGNQEKMRTARNTFEKDDTLARPAVDKKKRRSKRGTATLASDSIKSSQNAEVEFGTFTDKKPVSRRSRLSVRAQCKLKTNRNADHGLHQTPKLSPQISPPPPPPPETVEKESPPLPPLSDHERNELFLKTQFCQYYLLPLSQL